MPNREPGKPGGQEETERKRARETERRDRTDQTEETRPLARISTRGNQVNLGGTRPLARKETWKQGKQGKQEEQTPCSQDKKAANKLKLG